MTTTLKPIANRILIEPIAPETSRGGILLPDSAKEGTTRRGFVLSFGGTVDIAGLRVGSKVLFSSYTATPIKVDGAERFLVTDDDLLAILT